MSDIVENQPPKKGRISYKQKFEELDKQYVLLKESSDKSIESLQGNISDMDKFISEQNITITSLETKISNNSTVVELESNIATSNTIITSLENKVRELEETITHLKTRIPKPKVDSKKLQGIKFKNGKFVKNGIEYNTVDEAKNGKEEK